MKPDGQLPGSTRNNNHVVCRTGTRYLIEESRLLWFRIAQGARELSLLRATLGVIFAWFGMLKFFPDLSPAEVLAQQTIDRLTLGLVGAEFSIIILALLETGIGLLLLLNVCRRIVIMVAVAHLCCTFVPAFLFPDQFFGEDPFSLTLTGQYIVKNVILIGALLTIRQQP